jgi:hypothetical protein
MYTDYTDPRKPIRVMWKETHYFSIRFFYMKPALLMICVPVIGQVKQDVEIKKHVLMTNEKLAPRANEGGNGDGMMT